VSNDPKIMRVDVLRARQPFSDVWVGTVSSSQLEKFVHIDRFRKVAREGQSISGIQREDDGRRIDSIKEFASSNAASFPNAVILAVNYGEDGNLITPDKRGYAHLIAGESKGRGELVIPDTGEKTISVIDGQHRLMGIWESKIEIDLICSFILDLPLAYQAEIFATINYNQKKVSKSLAYELFGFDLDAKDFESWTPERLAVFLARRLREEPGSPLYGKIAHVAMGMDNPAQGKPPFSLASVVDGILKLISRKPQRDRAALRGGSFFKKKTREGLSNKDNAPLRELYIQTEDKTIYQLILNFLLAFEQKFWKEVGEGSFIKKTTGLLAAFRVLELLAADAVKDKDISVERFVKRFGQKKINFDNEYFSQASGQGVTRMKNAILFGMNRVEGIPKEQIDKFTSLAL